GAAVDGRTLQRPPPLIRIFRPPSEVRSSRVVSTSEDAAKIAAIVPAAPAPMIATRPPRPMRPMMPSRPRLRSGKGRRYGPRFAPEEGTSLSKTCRLTYACFAPKLRHQGRWAGPARPPDSRGGPSALFNIVNSKDVLI